MALVYWCRLTPVRNAERCVTTTTHSIANDDDAEKVLRSVAGLKRDKDGRASDKRHVTVMRAEDEQLAPLLCPSHSLFSLLGI